MKIKQRLFVLSIFVCEFYLAYTSNILFSQVSFAQDADCQNAISNSIRRIENARSTIVKFEQFKQRYQDYPTNRSLGYDALISGEGAVDVMSSKVFLTDISTQIISNCKSISSVTFGRYKTDWIRTYGLMENGKIEPFKCISAGRGAERELSWGKEICL
ncbi:MAG: hypothetical protein ACK5QY_00210 [Pseudanabaena sp.]